MQILKSFSLPPRMHSDGGQTVLQLGSKGPPENSSKIPKRAERESLGWLASLPSVRLACLAQNESDTYLLAGSPVIDSNRFRGRRRRRLRCSAMCSQPTGATPQRLHAKFHLNATTQANPWPEDPSRLFQQPHWPIDAAPQPRRPAARPARPRARAGHWRAPAAPIVGRIMLQSKQRPTCGPGPICLAFLVLLLLLPQPSLSWSQFNC